MAIQMVCSCGQELVTEDEHAGRKVRCPICQSIVAIPGVRRRRGTSSEEEDEYSSREEGLSKRDRLARARLGLGLHWGKSLCFVILSGLSLLLFLTILVLVLARTAEPMEGSEAMRVVFGVLGCLSMVVFYAMPALAVVGSLLCFWLPERSGGRLLSMVACGLDSGAFVVLAVAALVYFSTVGSVGTQGVVGALGDFTRLGKVVLVLSLLGCVLLLAGWILHMLVLRNLADYSRYRRTASEVMQMLVIGLVTLIVPAIIIVIFARFVPRLGNVGGYIYLILLVAWTGGLLGVSFKVLNLTATVRRQL